MNKKGITYMFNIIAVVAGFLVLLGFTTTTYADFQKSDIVELEVCQESLRAGHFLQESANEGTKGFWSLFADNPRACSTIYRDLPRKGSKKADVVEDVAKMIGQTWEYRGLEGEYDNLWGDDFTSSNLCFVSFMFDIDGYDEYKPDEPETFISKAELEEHMIDEVYKTKNIEGEYYDYTYEFYVTKVRTGGLIEVALEDNKMVPGKTYAVAIMSPGGWSGFEWAKTKLGDLIGRNDPDRITALEKANSWIIFLTEEINLNQCKRITA